MAKKNVIILGAGFGGITAALTLAKKLGGLANEYEIILIDRHHHHLITPNLYEIASIPKEYAEDTPLKSSILIPIRDITEKKPINFICDEFIGLDIKNNKINLKNNGELSYEFLVFALGSQTNYFNIPGLKEHSFPLKTFDDGAKLRNTVEDLVKKREHIKIIVGGAGSSGIELIAEFSNFICAIKEKISTSFECNVELLLVEASNDILPGFEADVISKSKKRLEKLGIEIKTDTVISSVNKDHFLCQNGKKENFDLLIWTGGVKGPKIFENLGLKLSPKGSLEINDYLQAQGNDGPKSPLANGHSPKLPITNWQSRIFAIGDNSSMINPRTEKPLVWNVPVAEAEGRLVAKNIIRMINCQSLIKFLPLKKYPFILAIGKKYAVADLIFIRFSGLLGWTMKQLVELRYLLFILPFRKAISTWLLAIKYYTSND